MKTYSITHSQLETLFDVWIKRVFKDPYEFVPFKDSLSEDMAQHWIDIYDQLFGKKEPVRKHSGCTLDPNY